MGKQLKRDEKIAEFRKKIEECKTYSRVDPNPAERVEQALKNPCGESLCYVKVTYEEMQTKSSTKKADRAAYTEQERKECNPNEMNCASIIITYEAVNGNLTFDTSCTTIKALINNLLDMNNKSDDKNVIDISSYSAGRIKRDLRDLKSSYSGSERYKSYKKIYALASCDEYVKKLSQELNAKYAEKVKNQPADSSKPKIEYDLEGTITCNLSLWTNEKASKSDMDIFKSFSKESNDEIERKLGGFINRGKDVDAYRYTFDIGSYVSSITRKITREIESAESMAYNGWKKAIKGNGIVDDVLEAKYSCYKEKAKDLGVKELKPSWTELQTEQNTLNKLQQNGEEFYEAAIKNENVSANMKAYQAVIREWTLYTDNGNRWVYTNKSVCPDGIRPKFKSKLNKNADAGIFKKREWVKTTTLLLFESEEIKETEIPYPNIQNLSAKEEEELQKKIDKIYEDISITINANFVPKSVQIYYQFENGEFKPETDTSSAVIATEFKPQAEELLKTFQKKEEEFLEAQKGVKDKKKLFRRLVVDTIPYDPWIQKIEKLEKLIAEWGKLPEFPEVAPKDTEKPKDENKYEDLPPRCRKCDKIFPINFLGLNLSKTFFGLFTAQKFILDDAGNKISYEDFMTQTGKPARCKAVNEIVTNEDKTEYNEIREKYLELIENKQDVKKTYVAISLPIGFVNGYAYFPTGKEIKFKFRLLPSPMLLPASIPDALLMNEYPFTGGLTSSMSLFAWQDSKQNIVYTDTDKPSVGTLTCDELGTYSNVIKVDEKTETSITCSGVKYDRYTTADKKPSNDLMGLLNIVNSTGFGDNEEAEDEGEDLSYTYVPKEGQITKAFEAITAQKEAEIAFDIYEKRLIHCGCPKIKEKIKMSAEEMQYNGKCQLEEFLTQPILLNEGGLKDLKTVNAIKKRALLRAQYEKEAAKNASNICDTLMNAWDTAAKIKEVDLNKRGALDTMYEAAGILAPALRKLPLSCIVEDAPRGMVNAVCEASRESKKDTSISDLGDSIAHTASTAGILCINMFNSAVDKGVQIGKTLVDVASPYFEAADNLRKNFSLFKLCPRRFTDYLDESGALKAPSESLKALQKVSILNTLKTILGECMVKGIVTDMFGPIDSLTGAQKKNIVDLLQTGNFGTLQSLISGSPDVVNKLSNGYGVIDATKVFQSGNFSMSQVAEIGAGFGAMMNPTNVATSVVQNFLSPSNLMNYAAEAAKGSRQLLTGLAAGELDQVEEAFVNQAKGIGGSALSTVQSSTGVDVGNLITTGAPAQVVKNKEKEIDKFILDAGAEFTSLPSANGKDPLATPMSDEEIDAYIANYEQSPMGKFFARQVAQTQG